MTTATPQFIANAHQPDMWRCDCGNMPCDSGFYPCLPDGTEIEPDTDSAWDGLYVCAGCGAIIALYCTKLPYADGQIVRAGNRAPNGFG